MPFGRLQAVIAKFKEKRMTNGKPTLTPPPQLNGVPPGSAFVTVFAHPSLQGPGNPNGVAVMTNFPKGNQKASLSVFSLLSEGVHRWSEHLQMQLTGKVAPNIVMPDGSPAPLPQEENDEVPK
jgi:hypothetical protein